MQRSQDEEALRAMDEAFSLIPHEEKEAYMEAQRRVPHLLKKESNPIWFLKFDRYNPWAASKRLAMFWKRRKEIFGPERAFLPLEITGEGAMGKEAIELFNSGFISFLPFDQGGRSVFLHDESKKIKCDIKHRIELLFYLFRIFMENPATVDKGIVPVVLVKSLTLNSELAHVGRFCTTFPNFFHMVHFIPMENATSLLDRIAPFFLRIMAHLVKQDNFVVHKMGPKADLFKELAKHGLAKEGLPTVIGGSWTYDQHELWLEHRLRIEWNLPLFGAARKLYSNHRAKKLSEMTEAEKGERRRRYNVLNSRRKRRRDRIENDSLLTQVAQLQQANNEVEEDNRRLERLVAECSTILEKAQEYTQLPANFKMNNLKVFRHLAQRSVGDGAIRHPVENTVGRSCDTGPKQQKLSAKDERETKLWDPGEDQGLLDIGSCQSLEDLPISAHSKQNKSKPSSGQNQASIYNWPEQQFPTHSSAHHLVDYEHLPGILQPGNTDDFEQLGTCVPAELMPSQSQISTFSYPRQSMIHRRNGLSHSVPMASSAALVDASLHNVASTPNQTSQVNEPTAPLGFHELLILHEISLVTNAPHGSIQQREVSHLLGNGTIQLPHSTIYNSIQALPGTHSLLSINNLRSSSSNSLPYTLFQGQNCCQGSDSALQQCNHIRSRLDMLAHLFGKEQQGPGTS